MGLLDSAQTLLSGVLSLARTRLELFGTELQEALTRLSFALELMASYVRLRSAAPYLKVATGVFPPRALSSVGASGVTPTM